MAVTGAPLDAVALREVDYFAWRLTNVSDVGLPEDPMDRWLWIVHAYDDWRRAG